MNNTTQYAIVDDSSVRYILMARTKRWFFSRWSAWEQIRVVQDKTTAHRLIDNHKRCGLFVLDVEIVV